MKEATPSPVFKPAAAILMALALSVSTHAGDPGSADDWFQSSYGPLWADAPFDNVEAILDHYSAEIVTHSSNGAIHRTPRREWLMAPMEAWQAEGWLRAKLTGAQTTTVNATTASIMTTWEDYYAGGGTEVSCGWYLVDKVDDQWQITTYADTPCP